MAERVPRLPPVDMSDVRSQRMAAQNISTVFNAAPRQVHDAGVRWYSDVHEATSKGVRGTSTDVHRGAGLVAAVSPQMDWDNRNIHAIKELHTLKEEHWKAIERGDRTPLQGMSIAAASTHSLMKAKRLMEGEDVDDVLTRRTAPKTHSFAHNIAHPDVAGHVTIDGRAHDIATNRLQGWEQGRGIGSAALPSGKTTRYEHFEKTYRTAADALTRQHGREYLPHEIQAVTWEMGKVLERSGTTKAGNPRKVGVRRSGQPYVGPGGLLPTPQPRQR